MLRLRQLNGWWPQVRNDPSEYRELSREQPQKLAEMQARYAVLRKTLFEPDRGTKDPRACDMAVGAYGTGAGGFWGPFAFLNSSGR